MYLLIYLCSCHSKPSADHKRIYFKEHREANQKALAFIDFHGTFMKYLHSYYRRNCHAQGLNGVSVNK